MNISWYVGNVNQVAITRWNMGNEAIEYAFR